MKEMIKQHRMPVVFHFSQFQLVKEVQNAESSKKQQVLSLHPCASPSLNIDMKRMRDRQKYSDFTIACGKTEFKIHKFILAARSDVFDTMFAQEDTVESKSGRVAVTDEAKIVELMLDFVYTDYCRPSNGEEIMKLLICADKYNLKGLKKVCEEHFIEDLKEQDIDLVIKLFKLADMMKLHILKAESIKNIAWRFKEVKVKPIAHFQDNQMRFAKTMPFRS